VILQKKQNTANYEINIEILRMYMIMMALLNSTMPTEVQFTEFGLGDLEYREIAMT